MKTSINKQSNAVWLTLSIFCSFLAVAVAQDAVPQPPKVDASGFPIKADTKKKPKSTLMIEMRPSQKRSLSLKLHERNPYAARSEEQRTTQGTGRDSEESRLRSRIGSLSVTGSSRGANNNLKVQMGDITLEEGRVLPQLIEDQTVNLQVTELTEETITLGWLDIETMELTGKTMMVPYDLSPKIMYQLSGQMEGSKEAGAPTTVPKMGYLQIGKKRRNQAARIASKDPSRDLPREIREASQ